MEGKGHHDLRWGTMSPWILLVILIMLPYSVSACDRDFCAQCSTNGYSCTLCIGGYYLYYGNCYQCQDSNCATCSSSSTCTGCNDGYYLDNARCYQCLNSNCVTCSSSSTCTGCNDGYYLYNGNCNRCQDSNCVTCSSSSICTGCNVGYYLNNGNCYQCLNSNCATCSSSSTCTGCNDGYYLYNGNCHPCQDSNCATCSIFTCDVCMDGNYLLNGSCYQCPGRCSTCSSSAPCMTCKNTYWNLPGYCALYCPTGCKDNGCGDTTGYCFECVPGKYGPTCEQDCNVCRDEQCDLRQCTNGCKDGYVQISSIGGDFSHCLKCNSPNCITCSNTSYCTQCEQGYYRHHYGHENSDGGFMSCLPCYESCLDCNSTEQCHADCIKQCNESINHGTTKSTHRTTTTTKTTPYQRLLSTSIHETTGWVKSTAESSSNNGCQCLNDECHKELNSCLQQVYASGVSEEQYRLTFGHGLAIGIGISIALFGCGLGIALCIRKKTNLHKHCFRREDDHSDERHEYVNTNMTDILSVTSDHDEGQNNNQTASSASTNVDSSEEYVSLGERLTHESDYTDLQNT